MKRLGLCLFAAFASLPAFAGEPDLSSPAATVRSYLLATKANDTETAKKCWAADDVAASSMLDVVVATFIETRKLVAATDAKFGVEGLKVLGQSNRPDCTDRAIDRTLERVAAANVREGETAARMVVAWAPEDRQADPAVLCGFPFRLRRMGDQWKLDASVLIGADAPHQPDATARALAIGRDQIDIFKDSTAALKTDQFKDLAQFERELKARVEAVKAKYQKKD